MEVIVVNRKLTLKEWNSIKSQLLGSKNIFLFSNVDLPDSVASFSKGPIELAAETKKKINYKVFNQVLDFGEKEIIGQSITDFLSYEKTSVWHYHKFRIYFLVRNLMYEMELLEKLAKENDKIICYSSSEMLAKYAFDNPKIKVITQKEEKYRINLKSLISYLIFITIRISKSMFKNKWIKKYRHIIIDHALKQTCLNFNTLKPELNNYNLAYLYEQLPDDFLILDDFEIPKLKSGLTFKFDITSKAYNNRFYGEAILFKGLLNSRTRQNLKIISEDFKGKYDKIESLISNPIDKLIFNYLKSLHKTTRFFLFKYLSYRRFFAKHQFKSVSSIDENSPRIKSILDAAKFASIKTIGIQHGTIHELHPAFIFTKEDKIRHIVPDITFVWGNHWKNMLLETGNYPENSIEIAGQIRTDIIPKLSKANHNNTIHKTILYASQFQRDLTIREKAAIDIFNSMKDFNDTHLIIKLHPSEKNEFAYYHGLAKKTGCTNYSITYYSDLYELLYQSDIVITCFSTVGAEAIYFGKPLIILDHLKQDLQNYHRSGVAFQATNSDELKHHIDRLLNENIYFDQQNYQRFITEYAYKIDGQVSKRILNFINGLK